MRSRNSQAAAVVVMLICLTGCYERVVGVKGLGAQGVSVSQPNSPEPARKSTTTIRPTVRHKEAPSR
jgi:hypothetical protein